jgi:hypothetical protein
MDRPAVRATRRPLTTLAVRAKDATRIAPPKKLLFTRQTVSRCAQTSFAARLPMVSIDAPFSGTPVGL